MATTDEISIMLSVPAPPKAIVETLDDPGRSWLLLGLNEEMNRRIEELALRSGDSKADLINRAIGPYKAVSDAIEDV